MNTQSVISIPEFQRRIKVFARTLPNSPEGLPWSLIDVSRVMLKASPDIIYNPARSLDKIDIHHDLRRQYYNDIKLVTLAKVQQLRRDRSLQHLRMS